MHIVPYKCVWATIAKSDVAFNKLPTQHSTNFSCRIPFITIFGLSDQNDPKKWVQKFPKMAKNGIKGKIYSYKWAFTAEKWAFTAGFLMYIFIYNFSSDVAFNKLPTQHSTNFEFPTQHSTNFRRSIQKTFRPF